VKRLTISSLLVALCVLNGLAGLPEARGEVTIECTKSGWEVYPMPDLFGWQYRLTADEPILAIGNIRLAAPVPQVWSCYDHSTVYLDDWQGNVFLNPDWAQFDTHLLISSGQIASTTGLPLTEGNDGSNPAGLSLDDGVPYGCAGKAGMGMFGQPGNGMMILRPECQSTSLDLIQIAMYGWDPSANLSLDVYTAAVARQLVIGPYTMNGPCGYYCPFSYDFGNVRVGTTASKNADIGQAGTCTACTYDGDILQGVAVPFGRNAQHVYFSPQSRGWFDQEASAVEWTGTAPVSLSGRGVGPVFNASQAPGTTVEFGEVSIDSFFDVLLDVGNVTGDPESGELTKLTVSAEITGDAAGAFEVIGQDVLGLLKGEAGSLGLRLDAAGLAPGDYLAQLVLSTDIGAACGATDQGETYCFGLSGTVVPEPSMLAVMAGLLALGTLRFTRRKKS